MCLGIVGQIVELSSGHPHLARVDVAGLVRDINIAILAEENLQPGDFILIHAGFAMEKIDEQCAREQTAALKDYTGNSDDPPAPLRDDEDAA
jgi:hydrogenase expression/formation protein HypC